MNHLARTIVEYIAHQSSAPGRFLFILPSYPSGVLRAIGSALEERFERVTDRSVTFTYGIAFGLGEEWARSDSSQDRDAYDYACRKGWYNEGNNLTSLRNQMRDPEAEDTLVTVLAGYDHIPDRASLGDFVRLDDGAIWEMCLRRSFCEWVEAWLGDMIDLEDHRARVEQIAAALGAIYDQGLADLPGISSYLTGLEGNRIYSGTEAYKLVLSNLSAFKLPPMPGLADSGNKRSLASCIGPAQEFASYSAFLDASKRKKTLETVKAFRESEPPEPEEEKLGEFGTLPELLDSLERYITDRSEEDRQRLLGADFAYLHQKVMGHKEKRTKSTKSSTMTKLRGLPPEVFLRALWLTLADYVRDARERMVAPDEDLLDITLRSLLFKHDIDVLDSDSGRSSDRYVPETFLRKVLGGIDDLLEERIQFGKGEGRQAVELRSFLAPGRGDQFGYRKSGTAEPSLKFEVIVSCGNGHTVKRVFLWCLPRNHPSRLLVDLYDWALDEFRHGGNALPAYAVHHLPEVFLARDDDEVNRLVGVALGHQARQVVDLLSAEGMDPLDPALTPLTTLSARFQAFLRRWNDSGFFAALDSQYHDLRHAYVEACRTLLENPRASNVDPLIIKAFFLVDESAAAQEGWEWQPYLKYGVASPLHPAVLDMLHHQHAFLCETFCARADNALREFGRHSFSERAWDRMVDLAQIERPLFGTLRDRSTVDGSVRSHKYIHLIGQCPTQAPGISSRLLLDYEGEEDEDVTDTELFRETRASALVCNTLSDYWELHAHADDGLSVGAYCGQEIQPIIAGLDAFLEKILREREGRPYGLRVTIFSSGQDDSSATRWLDAWRERWQEAELSSTKRHYGNCRISVAYRVVQNGENRKSLADMLKNTAMDVMFFTDFIESSTGELTLLDADECPDDGFRQFPVLEMAGCVMSSGGKAYRRERVLSHRRFGLASLHAEVMARIIKGPINPTWRHALISQSDFLPWKDPISAAHKDSTWVVCIDPAVDELLLRRSGSDETAKREIIGFGTGVGTHGENNYTISTEQFAFVDLKARISAQLASILGPCDDGTNEKIARELIQEASNMAGLSVVKATGPSEYIRDYIAYATLRKLLPQREDIFCDEIISLDAFRHWFDDAPDGTRPDLLRLQARIVDGYFEIQAQIFECKVAQRSEDHLDKARSQVIAGLNRLVLCFQPRRENAVVGIDDAPDQRYWWMQLERIVASRGSVPTLKQREETLSALEHLAEGFFSISWQGAVVALWTDGEADTLRRETEWTIQIDGEDLTIPAFTSGGRLVQDVCLNRKTDDLLKDAPAIRRTFRSISRQPETNGPDRKGALTEEPVRSADTGDIPEVGGTGLDSSGEGNSSSPTPRGGLVPVKPSRRVPERILLGDASPRGAEVFWEFGHPQLTNRHILVFGASGTGKTYTIQALLCELGRGGQNALIVDYTNGFTTKQLEGIVVSELNPKQHIVRRQPLPINPFRQQCDFIDDIPLEEEPSMTAQRVMGVFSEVYQLGDQQKSALYTSIRDGLVEEGASFDLESLMKRLEEFSSIGGPTASSAASVLSRIQPLVDMEPFGQEQSDSWENLFNDQDSRCHVIQLMGFSKDIARLITEFSLIDLYRYYRAMGSKNRPRVIVLDEIQNLDHSLNSPLGQLLTEGRKFGISLILATQTLSSLNRDERDRLFQASHKLFFKPADTELKSFAQILADATGERNEEWVARLSRLSRGECYSLGPVRNESTGSLDMKRCIKLRIRSLEERL